MAELSRRAMLRTFGVGAMGAAALAGYELMGSGGGVKHNSLASAGLRTARNGPPVPSTRIREENARPGSTAWKIGAQHTVSATDVAMEIKGFASKTSVHVGDAIDFHVSCNRAQRLRIDVYRFGHYRGFGARLVTSSPSLVGTTQSAPQLDAFGTITCAWSPSWTLRVPTSWVSGMHVAVLTSAAGFRSYVPFVVRDDRPAQLLVVVPFTTYQAYNQFPFNGRLGKSLYYGWSPAFQQGPVLSELAGFTYDDRARRVSFDRPFAMTGLPKRAQDDQAFAFWAESVGYDMTYSTSLDLHAGRLDLTQYAGVIFSGHDEYWSMPMRQQVTAAVASGTSLAYLSANNVYWHVRCDKPTAAGEIRSMHCYKTDPDPTPDASGPTTQWRLMPHSPSHAEQGLVGVQYNGIVAVEVPLVVQRADHWMWKGTGVRNGDQIPRLVGVEADGFNPKMPSPAGAKQTLLSASPFLYRDLVPRQEIQNTSVCEMPNGAVVFAAGTMNWPLALGAAGRLDDRVRTATANVFRRILRPSTP
ncbi:MAG TPA: N,N-dimethylformamidase beta subunit family domain-containing protein [Micromonosporaceae bacterium]|nr:N,N-dimethylformamidase beta subunit family domain-containing protein [Micromonosporaceae bacterium]